MKFLVLALALIGAASAVYVTPYSTGYGGLGYPGYGGLGYSGIGWGGHGLGYSGWGNAPVISAYSAPAVVAAPAYGHIGYNAGWGHGLGYAAPVWGIDAWKKKKAA